MCRPGGLRLEIEHLPGGFFNLSWLFGPNVCRSLWLTLLGLRSCPLQLHKTNLSQVKGSSVVTFSYSLFCFFQEIVLKKGSSTLGFSIVGGSDHASHPFGMDEPGVFISKVGVANHSKRWPRCLFQISCVRLFNTNKRD